MMLSQEGNSILYSHAALCGFESILQARVTRLAPEGWRDWPIGLFNIGGN